MNAYYAYLNNPKTQKAALAAHSIQAWNDALQDPLWKSMTTTLQVFVNESNFMEILRSFWTTFCIFNGIEAESVVYECLSEQLSDEYKSIGVELDTRFLGQFIHFDDADDENNTLSN